MTRKLFSVILALILVLALAICGHAETDSHVYDEADLLTSAQERALSAQLQTISANYQAQIVVATVSSTHNQSADAFVEYFYDSKQLGYGSARDGVLLLLCMDSREYRILSNGYASEAISPGRIDRIGEVIVSDLSDGNYADAFSLFAEECAYYLDGHLNGFPFDTGKSLLIALVVGLIVGMIVVFVLKGQLKSVRPQNQADVYVKAGSMHLSTHLDLFLYRTVSKRRKESSSSSRSGSSRSGSSRSVGGGRF